MVEYLLIALGGAIGSVCRWALSNLISRQLGHGFPWGTILVNASGSLLIGVLAAVTTLHPRLSENTRAALLHFVMIGICGGYTTFSSFSLQTLSLIQSKQYLAAGGNVLLSVVLCLMAVTVGHWLGTLFVPAAPH